MYLVSLLVPLYTVYLPHTHTHTHVQPKHEVDGKKLTKHKHTLEHSTGSDKVSSFVRPVKRTFSLSRRQHSQRKSIYGSTQSLNVDHNQAGYSTMPSYAGHLGISRRSSPSFHSSNHNPRKKHGPVIKSQSVRLRSKKRASLYLLTTNTASLYIEQEGVDPVLPNTTLEVSGEYEYGASRSIKKSSSIRKSHSSVQSRSKSPIPPTSTNSVLDTMHMYTVSEVIAQQESSPFALLSKFHLEHLNLGSSSFDTCLAFEPPKKEHTTFRTPLGMRQRPLSSLDMQLVAMRNDGTAASRLTSNVLRLKQISAVNPVITNEQQEPSVTDGVTLMSNGGVVLRRRLSMLGPNAQPRPVSASFIEPPTVRKLQAVSRMLLQPHGGSLTDLTSTTVLSSLSFSPPMQGDGSPTSKIRPKRPAPQAPSGRPHSRTSTPESGSSTPKSFRPNSPLVKQYSNSSQSSRSSNDTLSGITGAINGRITPNNTHHRSSAVGIRPRSPIIHPPSPPHMIIGSGMHRNASSPQLPMIPIQEEDIYTTTTAEITPSSPSTPHMIINGPTRDVPPPYIHHDSLYISPRKQSLTIDKSNITNLNRLRASQILETGGIQDGDLSSSRMDLLEGIRKGIQLKQVQKEEREKQNLLISMPWDVAAILERRLVMESDSETSESESNDTEWEDED